MKTNTCLATTPHPKTAVGPLRTGCARRLLLLLVTLTFPAVVQAGDFSYATNDGAIAITGYTGPGGDVTIPKPINGLPVYRSRSVPVLLQPD
jgi:hypothetical protein